jgi:UDP-glucose 4-epimerase
MKKYGNKKILFASSSAIYGNNSNNLNESTGPLLPISNYGAAKLASEAFISSFCASNDLKALIIRFPNVVGYRLTHGVIYDFIEKLKSNSTQLLILGNGKQQKPYLYIDDLLNAIDLTLNSINNKVTIYNVAPNSLTTVKFIADIVINVMKLNEVELQYTGGDIGWIGDVPTFSYDTTKINHLGWSPNFTSNEAVIKSIEEEIQYRESHYYSS